MFKSIELLEMLQADVRQIILATSHLQKEDPAVLLQQPAEGKWSVVQVLEHLNSYGRYYLPAIKQSLLKDQPAQEDYKPGWIGDYFTKLMQPKEGKVKSKMKAPKAHTFTNDLDPKPVIDEFIEQQHELIDLLEAAKKKNIGTIRTPISISRLIKLKVGDTFRFLIAHEQRHFIQIKNAVITVKEIKDIYRASHLAV